MEKQNDFQYRNELENWPFEKYFHLCSMHLLHAWMLLLEWSCCSLIWNARSCSSLNQLKIILNTVKSYRMLSILNWVGFRIEWNFALRTSANALLVLHSWMRSWGRTWRWPCSTNTNKLERKVSHRLWTSSIRRCECTILYSHTICRVEICLTVVHVCSSLSVPVLWQ